MTSRKSHRIGSMLLALVMVLSLGTFFCFHTAHAAELESFGEWKYTVENGRATITSYIGTSKTVTVPARINGISVSTVNGLSNNAYKSRITSIKFENGITELGPSLCSGYSALEQVTLPNTLRTIGRSAFASCTNLRGIVIPASVTAIGDFAFQSCSSLYSATLNCSVTTIPKSMFASCSKLGNVTLPNSCTDIMEGAFSDCTTLAKVVMPNSVKTIGNNAFKNCSNLSGELTLPAELKTIGEDAFSGCSSITKILIPNKIRDIQVGAFSSCTALKDILIGKTVQKIGNNAFLECKSLEKIVFGGGYSTLSTTAIDFGGSVKIYYPSSESNEWMSFKGLGKASYSAPRTITITGSKELTVNDKLTLKVSVSPNTSVIGKCYYLTSSNPAVATVDQDGNITAKSGGKATITATTINGITSSVTVTVKPKTVTNVKAVSQTTSSVQITWKVSDNVTGYIVYRSTTKSSGFKQIGTSLTNSYTDKGLTKGKTYYYKVRAYSNSEGASIQSASSTAATVKVSAPAPATISAKKSKSKVAQITWSKSIGAQGYEIYMATSSGGKYTKIKTITSGSTLSFKKTGLTAGKTYYFRVRSYITVNGSKVYSSFTKVVKCTV